MSTPFRRAIAMMTALSAAMSLPVYMQQGALDGIGAYTSRGKGGKRPHRSVGTKAFQRTAAKLRNRRANRG